MSLNRKQLYKQRKIRKFTREEQIERQFLSAAVRKHNKNADFKKEYISNKSFREQFRADGAFRDELSQDASSTISRFNRANRLLDNDTKAYTSESITERTWARIKLGAERQFFGLAGGLGEAYRQSRRATTAKQAKDIRRDFFYRSAANFIENNFGVPGEAVAQRIRNKISNIISDDPKQAFQSIKKNFTNVSDVLDDLQKQVQKISKSNDRAFEYIRNRLDNLHENERIQDIESNFEGLQEQVNRLEKLADKKTETADVSEVVTKVDRLYTNQGNIRSEVDELRALYQALKIDFDQFKKNGGGGSGQGIRSFLAKNANKQQNSNPNSMLSFLGMGGIGSLLGRSALGRLGASAVGSVATSAASAIARYGQYLKFGGGALAGAGIAYGAYQGLSLIGDANRERDAALGIDENTSQEDIEKKRREFHRKRKNKGYEDLREETKKLKEQYGGDEIPAAIPTQPDKKSGFFGLGGFPKTSQNPNQSVDDRIYKNQIDQQKSQFMQFGKLPPGFEFITDAGGRAPGGGGMINTGGGTSTGGSRGSGDGTYSRTGQTNTAPMVSATEDAKKVIAAAVAGNIPLQSFAVDKAMKMEGLHERADREVLKQFLAKGSNAVDPATTAWCAAFVNSALAQSGMIGTGSAVATSFMNWGELKQASEVQKGDVLVEHRGRSAGETGGHVGMATGEVKRNNKGEVTAIQIVEGNYRDQVGVKRFVPANQVQVRRATDANLTPEAREAFRTGKAPTNETQQTESNTDFEKIEPTGNRFNRVTVPVDGRPASERYNNPGAAYPSKDDEKYGLEGYGVIGGGHLIGKFPTATHGAAANFALWDRKYVGKTLQEAVNMWRGGNGSLNVPAGFDPNMRLTKEQVRDKNFMVKLFKGMAEHEAGKGKSTLTEQQLSQAHDWFQAGGAPKNPNAPISPTTTTRTAAVGAPGAPQLTGSPYFGPMANTAAANSVTTSLMSSPVVGSINLNNPIANLPAGVDINDPYDDDMNDPSKGWNQSDASRAEYLRDRAKRRKSAAQKEYEQAVQSGVSEEERQKLWAKVQAREAEMWSLNSKAEQLKRDASSPAPSPDPAPVTPPPTPPTEPVQPLDPTPSDPATATPVNPPISAPAPTPNNEMEDAAAAHVENQITAMTPNLNYDQRAGIEKQGKGWNPSDSTPTTTSGNGRRHIPESRGPSPGCNGYGAGNNRCWL